MNLTHTQPFTAQLARQITTLLLPALIGMGSLAWAQPVYKIVGPDGRISFSDRPAPHEKAEIAGSATVGKSTSARQSLPFELQQVVNKYPVTLYTTNNCAPCSSGRALLSRRGVPYTEKTVNTNEDVKAFSQISKDTSMPLLTIGGQQVLGFSEAEWGQYLDSAGYPKKSVLPSSYRHPAPEPMAPLPLASETTATDPQSAGTTGAAADGDAATSTRKVPPPPPKPQDRTSNPAGIRF